MENLEKKKRKIRVLKDIANQLNNENIIWNLGAAGMLYLRGMVEDFDDLDIMVSLEDVKKIETILDKLGTKTVKEKNQKFKTKVFLEYEINGIEVDIMAGFTIIHDGKEYYFPLESKSQSEKINLDHTVIYLGKLNDWLMYYQLMNRVDKVKIIQDYIKKLTLKP